MINEISAVRLGNLIAAGELSSMEATQYFLKSRNEKINGFTSVNDTEIALNAARQADKRMLAGARLSPLDGVPMALKDNICTDNMPSTCASRFLKEYTPPYNATAWERLEASGAVLIGKLNMDEFAMGGTSEKSCFGPATNPYDNMRSAGGSSGGTAAAVAAGECSYALGTDTGGSVRQPAAHCGVLGLRPTYGSVSRYGVVAFASSMDQIGIVAKTAEDCEIILKVICGYDSRDMTSLKLPQNYCNPPGGVSNDLRGVKIGVPDECFAVATPEVREAVLSCANVLEDLGATVERCSFPLFEYATSAYFAIACVEGMSNLARYDGLRYGATANAEDIVSSYSAARGAGFGLEVKRRILLGALSLEKGYYARARRARYEISCSLERLTSQYDVLLTPTAASTAPLLGQANADPTAPYKGHTLTVPASLAGLPSLSIPCGEDGRGLPVGALLTGGKLTEGVLLKVARAYAAAVERSEGG